MAVAAEIEAALAELTALAGKLSQDEINRQPTPGAWSVAQNLEHLTITCRRMMEEMDKACAATQPKTGEPWKPGVFARWFLRSLEPPAKFKVKTPKEFDAPPQLDAQAVTGAFRYAHDQLLQRLTYYQRYDQNAVRVQSPFAKFIRYKLGTALAIIPAHMRRHLDQSRRAIRIQ